jgi:hypothetical protein
VSSVAFVFVALTPIVEVCLRLVQQFSLLSLLPYVTLPDLIVTRVAVDFRYQYGWPSQHRKIL